VQDLAEEELRAQVPGVQDFEIYLRRGRDDPEAHKQAAHHTERRLMDMVVFWRNGGLDPEVAVPETLSAAHLLFIRQARPSGNATSFERSVRNLTDGAIRSAPKYSFNNVSF
jgi:hypothetical protein